MKEGGPRWSFTPKYSCHSVLNNHYSALAFCAIFKQLPIDAHFVVSMSADVSDLNDEFFSGKVCVNKHSTEFEMFDASSNSQNLVHNASPFTPLLLLLLLLLAACPPVQHVRVLLSIDCHPS